MHTVIVEVIEVVETVVVTWVMVLEPEVVTRVTGQVVTNAVVMTVVMTSDVEGGGGATELVVD